MRIMWQSPNLGEPDCRNRPEHSSFRCHRRSACVERSRVCEIFTATRGPQVSAPRSQRSSNEQDIEYAAHAMGSMRCDQAQSARTRRPTHNPRRGRRLAGVRDLPRPPPRPHRSRAESCSPGGCGDSSLRSRDDDAQVGEGVDRSSAAPFSGDLARRDIGLIRDHEGEGPRISPMSPLASCALNVTCRSLRGQLPGRPWRRPNG